MTKQVTIYEVAAQVGVSISTVSNALNRPERVSAATRTRVLEVADRLGFVPKPQAVSQARQGVGRVGVLAPFTSYASYLARLRGVLKELEGHPLEVVVFDIESAATATSPVLAASAIRGRLDGLIVMGERIDPDVEERLLRRGMPTVVVDADTEAFSVVTTDDLQGGRLAAEHLLQLGHVRFGYLLERQASEYESQARRRLEGFTRRLREAGVAEPMVQLASASVDSARAAARDLLDRSDRPTAVMAHFDDLAIGALHAARELGLDVPGDLSVMGFDDGPGAVAVGLTTMEQPFDESGALAARLLLSVMNEPGRRTATVLDCRLVRRSTTGPAS